MTNREIKEIIKTSNFYQWHIAAQIGVTEMTLIRWLRLPLDKVHKEKILSAITELKDGESNE